MTHKSKTVVSCEHAFLRFLAIRTVDTEKPLCYKIWLAHWVERSVTSRYHGGKISGSQQTFLTEMAICIVERWKKSTSYRFVPEWTVLFIFFFFSACHICRATICGDPEILLRWQRDVTTSPLYCNLILWLVEVTILQKRSAERGRNSSVLQKTLDTREKIYYHQANLDNFLFQCKYRCLNLERFIAGDFPH